MCGVENVSGWDGWKCEGVYVEDVSECVGEWEGESVSMCVCTLITVLRVMLIIFIIFTVIWLVS